MEPIELRKELEQDGQKMIMTFLLLISVFCGHAQEKITGEYRRIDPSTAARDISVRFIFKEDFKFERTEFGPLGAREDSKGNYLISEDTLILNYGKYDNFFENVVEVTQKEEIKFFTDPAVGNLPLYSNIQVFKKPDEPIAGAILVLRDEDQKQ